MNHLSTLYEVKGNFKGKSLGNPKHGIRLSVEVYVKMLRKVIKYSEAGVYADILLFDWKI